MLNQYFFTGKTFYFVFGQAYKWTTIVYSNIFIIDSNFLSVYSNFLSVYSNFHSVYSNVFTTWNLTIKVFCVIAFYLCRVPTLFASVHNIHNNIKIFNILYTLYLYLMYKGGRTQKKDLKLKNSKE